MAVTAAISCMLLRTKVGELSLLVSLVSVILIVGAAASFFEPVLEVFRRLRALSTLSDDVASPMLKAVGIGFLSQITVHVCEDAGERSLAKAVELAGGMMVLYTGLPLLSAVITMMEDLLR